jgi:hypothetical protein
MPVKTFDHVWHWKPRMKPLEKNRRGMLCRVEFYAGMRSCLVEMEDGEWVVADQYAVRPLTIKHIAERNRAKQQMLLGVNQ